MLLLQWRNFKTLQLHFIQWLENSPCIRIENFFSHPSSPKKLYTSWLEENQVFILQLVPFSIVFSYSYLIIIIAYVQPKTFMVNKVIHYNYGLETCDPPDQAGFFPTSLRALLAGNVSATGNQ